LTLNSINQYGHDFQIKVLSSLLTHKEFLVNIHDIISDEYFENPAQKWAIKEILKYYDKYHTTPSLDILKVELQKVDNEVLQISIKEQLKEAYVTSDEDLEYVQEEFTNFCKNQQLKKALMSSVDLLKGGDFDGIRYLIDNALKSGQDKNLGHEYIKDIESRYRENSRETVPTPWDKINNLLQGGLGNGDFGLIFGNPGGGKSWSLVALGGHAVRLGYNVLHYTLSASRDGAVASHVLEKSPRLSVDRFRHLGAVVVVVFSVVAPAPPRSSCPIANHRDLTTALAGDPVDADGASLALAVRHQ
jgi:replicative DNA helicase